MSKTGKAMVFSVLLMTLASCNTLRPKPTETPIPTETSLPTSTNTPEPTNTPTNTPTKTPVPPTETASDPVLPTPSGKPASEWEGIPVMPNAIAGEGDSKGYFFTIDAPLDEIQNYYEAELAKLGWNLMASGQGTTNTVMLIFINDTGPLSISIIPQSDGIMYVLIVK